MPSSITPEPEPGAHLAAAPPPTVAPSIKGRGAADNPANRFERMAYVPDPVDPNDPDGGGGDPDTAALNADPTTAGAFEISAPRTELFRDHPRTILTTNDSPDIPFDVSINPYRGCEHGCIYCYARPNHEHLGFSAGLDFETKIMVKDTAPDLLRAALLKKSWQPQVIAMSGITDCYQPIERKLRITRRCLEVFREFLNPVGIITKNHLVTRDRDLLAELAHHNAARVYISITSLDRDLTRTLEPRTSIPERRLAAIRELTEAGVDVGVMVAPVIPGLNDHEIPAILAAAAQAGASHAGYIAVRLPLAVAPLFEGWLDRHRPAAKQKILNRIRAMRGGNLNVPEFGARMRGEGAVADQIKALFDLGVRKAGLTHKRAPLSTAAFRRPLPAIGTPDEPPLPLFV
ncbi:MAG: PA0069 family radical SAM protein [Planctomycetota bacterium]